MLTHEERTAARDRVAEFAVNLFNAASTGGEQDIRNELEIFFEFFCSALEIARRDNAVSGLCSIDPSNN
jgi:hypothetical protein